MFFCLMQMPHTIIREVIHCFFVISTNIYKRKLIKGLINWLATSNVCNILKNTF